MDTNKKMSEHYEYLRNILQDIKDYDDIPHLDKLDKKSGYPKLYIIEMAMEKYNLEYNIALSYLIKLEKLKYITKGYSRVTSYSTTDLGKDALATFDFDRLIKEEEEKEIFTKSILDVNQSVIDSGEIQRKLSKSTKWIGWLTLIALLIQIAIAYLQYKSAQE